MRILITAGPTHEPIDPVRYIANRSSGRLGGALLAAALAGGHAPSVILGPVQLDVPAGIRRIDIQTAAQLQAAVLAEFPRHDLLIMAAAPADYTPARPSAEKIPRQGALVLELRPTEDIAAAAAGVRRPDQRIVGFSLESRGNLARAREKLLRKKLDLIVYNPAETMGSPDIEAILLWPDGRSEDLGCRSKPDFADKLMQRAVALFA